ncbi:rifin PIR protein,putative [Plasmodium sp. DRC-Itaito]|nr:rifin PIR protein,putative [Plasmodium sp. DRC-Itaito]
MKLDYYKILLFVIPLNILLTSYHVNTHRKPHSTPRHTQTTTSRMLSECDTQSSNYNNDEDIKTVKEIFDRQTTQRLREYDERMKEKRQKRKEERDKNIQEIIEKDKREKSLAEKVEKGCLKCGCGLGGVAASVGLFGGLGIYGWKISALATAGKLGAAKGLASAKAAGAEAGMKALIKGLEEMGVLTLDNQTLVSYFASTDYTNASLIFSAITSEYQPSLCLISIPVDSKPICTWVREKFVSRVNGASVNDFINKTVGTIVSEAEKVSGEAAKKATEDAIKASTLAVDVKYASCQTSTIASVVAIIIITLVMIIIYLVLRYRRKRK